MSSRSFLLPLMLLLAFHLPVRGQEKKANATSDEDFAKYRTPENKNPPTEEECRTKLANYTRRFGADHPDTIISRSHLAAALMAGKKLAEAEAEYRLLLASRSRVLGADHPDTLDGQMNLASVLFEQKKYGEAETVERALLAANTRVRGPDDGATIGSAFKLAFSLFMQNKDAESRAVLLPAFERLKAILPAGDPTLETFQRLARAIQLREEAEKKK